MQILEIVLYSNRGEMRTVYLRPGSANIITGRSATGKSALIAIVDYCLGSDDCLIPAGVIRNTVSWYGLRLQFASGQMFVARQNPPRDQQTTTYAFVEQGDEVPSPAQPPSAPNTTAEAIRTMITQRLGISPNRHTPPPDQTRAPLSASVRHALAYCFQEQDEVASKGILFHRQDEPFVPQAIKDTLPYFLGAIQEDQLALEQELVRLLRDLRRQERALREAEALSGENAGRSLSLLNEAIEVGLIDQELNTEGAGRVAELLQEIAHRDSSAPVFANEGRLRELQDELNNLRDRARALSDRIAAARSYAREAAGYAFEAQRQEQRLAAINLFSPNGHGHYECPVCESELRTPTPAVEAMRRSLETLQSNLAVTVREQPHIREYILGLEENRDEIRRVMRERNEALNGVLREQEAASDARGLDARRNRVVGRISLWLESAGATDESAHLKAGIARTRGRVVELEKRLDPADREERMASILNRIGARMTQLALRLNLEHSNNPVRLDIRRLTIVVDEVERPIPLATMGSGQNWLGYHLVALFSLHQHFRTHNRPVPSFLFLDQPSQVYYPSEQAQEQEGSLAVLTDDDRQAVLRIYEFITNQVESIPNFQVIVVDHADLQNSEFQASIVERWREGNALIPQSWITPEE